MLGRSTASPPRAEGFIFSFVQGTKKRGSMFQALYDPLFEIKKLKNQSYATVLLYVLASCLFETAGVFFATVHFKPEVISVVFIPQVFLGLIGAQILLVFFLSLAWHVLGGKGGFYEGFVSVVLGGVAPALSVFFTSVALFVPFGTALALVLLISGGVLGGATLFRCAKELFELEYAGVLVGFLITIGMFASASVLVYKFYF